MPTFVYKAKRDTGEEYEGTLEAADRFELYQHIRKEDATVVSFEESKGAHGINIRIPIISSFFGRIKETDKINFAKNLSAMLSAGLSLSRALQVMERQTKKAGFKTVLLDLVASIEKGTTFNDALAKHPKVFSSLVVSMVRAGEESGGLSNSLLVVGEQMDQTYRLKKKIKGALIYPGIIMAALVVIGALLLIFVVPTLSQTFTELGVELPTSTKMIIATSEFMQNHTISAIILFFGIVSGFYYGLKTSLGRKIFETVLLKMPIIKELVKETNSARTARTLSSLLSAGVDVVHSLEITADVVQHSYYRVVLTEAKEKIQKGNPLADVFHAHEDLYPTLVAELIAVGEETGKLPELLLRIAEFYELEVEQKTKDMSTIIEPFLMVIVGAVVGFFAVSMITPIYSVTEGI